MAKWFDQAREIEKLRGQVRRQAETIERLLVQLKAAGINPAENPYGVSEEERALVAEGNAIAAIKAYRERTGADLLTGKRAIDSLQSPS